MTARPQHLSVCDALGCSVSCPIALMREALQGCVEFLDHSGNQRSVLSGKFTTPSARYEWFQRVRKNAHAAHRLQLATYRDLEAAARAALDAAWGYANSTCQEFCVHGQGAPCPTKDPSLKRLENALAALDRTRQ